MSSEHEAMSEMLNMEEKHLLDKMKNRARTNSARLEETVLKKEEASKQAVANIFNKMREGKIPEAPVTAPDKVAPRLDEVKPPDPKPIVEEKPVKPVEKKMEDDFNLDTTFTEKLEEVRHEIPTESLTNPKVKDTVTKLRNMARELRGESVPSPAPPERLVVQPADSKQLVESKQEPVFTLKQLNSMLYRAQDKFNQTGNGLYESIADELSTVIAEALLSNKKAVPKSKISGPTRSF